MAENGNGKGPSWKYLSCLFIAILIAVGGYFLSEARSDIRSLQKEKLDKETYYQDIKSINDKLDKLLDMHMRDK